MKLKILIAVIFFSALCFAQLNNELNNFYMLGQNYEQAGELEKAKGIYEDLYKKQPHNYQVFDALNRIYILLKAYNSSVQIINDQINYSPQNITLYGILGTTYYLMGDENKAFKTWDDALNKFPKKAANYRTFGNYAIQMRTFNKAIEYLKKGEAIADDPKYFSYDLANIYALTMQYKESAKEYCSILSKDPKQINAVQTRIFSYINKPEALKSTIEVFKDYSGNDKNLSFDRILGRLYIENKSYKEAFDIYKEIDSKSKIHGAELFNFAELVYNDEQYSVAADVFNYILDNYPDSPFASRAKLGYAKTLEADLSAKDTIDDWKQFHFINSGKTDAEEKVISAYLDLTKIYPNSEVGYEAYLHAGRIRLYRQNDLTDAEKYFEKVIEETPSSKYGAAAYAEMGKINLLKGNLDSAEMNYSKILLNTKLSKESRNYAAYQLSKINFYKDNFEKADLVIFASAEFLAEQQKFKAAADKYKIIAQNPQAFLLQGISQFREAQMELALNNYNKSLNLLQNIANEGEKNIYADKALYLIGKIYQFSLNETNKAVEAYEKLLEKFPNSLYLDEVRNQIKNLRNKTS
ncbi:MAG: tetratricopeptide repeat protein [Ignavibacteriaceae bacterium]